MNRLWTYFALLLLASCAAVSEPETVEYNGYRFVHMDTERLPDMSVPRQYHLLLNLNGGLSFPNYLAEYRVNYARELMLCHPEKRLTEVAEESGFANEGSFFRSFKKLTGLTPSEWKENIITRR